MRRLLPYEEPGSDGIVAVDEPTGGADDVGLALDRWTDRWMIAERRFADQAAFDTAAANAKAGCPVSKLFNTKITMNAVLEK